MRRLFIGCDDTLLIFSEDDSQHPLGLLAGLPYNVNVDLVLRVERQARAGWEIIVWSSGGQEYAQRCGELSLGLQGIKFTALDKLAAQDLPERGDVVIDDQAHGPAMITQVKRWLGKGVQVWGPYGRLKYADLD